MSKLFDGMLSAETMLGLTLTCIGNMIQVMNGSTQRAWLTYLVR